MPNQTRYAVLIGKAIWEQYSKILRGGGGNSAINLVNSTGTVRDFDFKRLPAGNGKVKVVPAENMGMSFATTFDRLKKLKKKGYVWALYEKDENGRAITLPDGLGFTYNPKDPDHPMLTVTREMDEAELVAKLGEVQKLMVNTKVKYTDADFPKGNQK